MMEPFRYGVQQEVLGSGNGTGPQRGLQVIGLFSLFLAWAAIVLPPQCVPTITIYHDTT